MKGTKNPTNLIKTAIYRRKNKKNTFPYYGIWAYMGEYGSGKTLSAVKECSEILTKYNKAIFISNTTIKGINNKTYIFETAEELIKILRQVIEEKNENGYVIFMDEMHVVLSDLFGASDPIFLTYLSQLRKLGIVIIGTCQLYNKCPKVVRDYLRLSGQIIFCRKVLGGITINQFVDMETCDEMPNLKLIYKIAKWTWFIHTIELYECYDTKAVVTQIKNLINYKRGERKDGLSSYH